MKLLISFFTILVFLPTTSQIVNDTTSKLMASKKLNAVIVLAKQPFIEQQIDKRIVNVQSDNMAKRSNAFEILQKHLG